MNLSKVSKVGTRSLAPDFSLLLKSSLLDIRCTWRLQAKNRGPLVRPHPRALRSADINRKAFAEEEVMLWICIEQTRKLGAWVFSQNDA